MKKLVLTLAIVATACLSHGEGSIYLNNSTLTRARINSEGMSLDPVYVPFYVAVYWTTDLNSWNAPVEPFALGATGGPNTFGVFSVDGGDAYAIPGTTGGQTVSMQIYAWYASYGNDPYRAWLAGSPTATTGVRQITLAPEGETGTAIWQTPGQFNLDRFEPLLFAGRPAPLVVPEPSTLTLGALGGLGLLLRWRKSSRK